MSSSILLEAAVRILVMGALIYIALSLLRIHQVRAQRAAWLLALGGALAMPLLVAAQVGPKLLPPLTTFGAPVRTELAPALASRPASHNRYKSAAPSAVQPAAAIAVNNKTTLLSVARDVYVFVAVTLLLRLLLGLGLALFIRARARSLTIGDADDTDTRESARVGSPVTIASSILLPMAHKLWDESTLRIVLSHERAHVRQGDFYVQLLAGVHCALFWFNPFAWWLKRQLSDLGEALSDHAAVQHASSRLSYAEMLLAFARDPRSRRGFAATVGIAMARSSNLAPRIDRLLCERGFERSFAEQRRLPLLAAAAALLAIAVASATTRAVAAVVVEPKPDLKFVFVNVKGVAQPETADTPPASPAPLPSPPTLPALAAPAAPRAPAPPKMTIKGIHRVTVVMNRDQEGAVDRDIAAVMAVHVGNSETLFNEFGEHEARQLRRRHEAAAGDYVYYRENGQQYLVQDAAILERAKNLLAPIQALRAREEDLRQQQHALAARERALAEQERGVKVDTPNFADEIAELNKVAEQMRIAQASPQMRPESLALLQRSLGRIQGDLGRIEAQAAVQQGALGAQQGKLGEEEGRLGEEEGRLDNQNEKLADEMRERLKPLIQQAIKAGKIKPLEDR